MNYSLSTLKQTVRQLLRKSRPDPRLVTLAVLAAVFVLTWVVDLFHGRAVPEPDALFLQAGELFARTDAGEMGFQRMVEELLAMSGQFLALVKNTFLFGLLSSSVVWTLSYSYSGYCLALVRGKKPGFSMLLCAFPKWGWVLLKGFLIELFLVMWAVFIGFTGTVLSAALLFFGPDGKLRTVLLVLVWVLMAAWLVSILLSYSMSDFVLRDDKMDALEAISRSKAMMRGRKRHLLLLLLSLAGWICLCAGLIGGVAALVRAVSGNASAAFLAARLTAIPVLALILPYPAGCLAKFYDVMRHTDIAYGDWEGRVAPPKKSAARRPAPAETPQAQKTTPVEAPQAQETGEIRPDCE